jgi:hypothetical protein
VKTVGFEQGVNLLEVRPRGGIRGGAKALPKTKKGEGLLKKAILQEKTEEIKKVVAALDLSKCNNVQTVVKDAEVKLTHLFDLNKDTASAVGIIKHLLQNVKPEILGTGEGDSKLLDVWKNHKNDGRLHSIGKLIMRSNFAELYDLFETVSGLEETASLTFEVIATRAFVKDTATASWDWTAMKKLVEAEITARQTLATRGGAPRAAGRDDGVDEALAGAAANLNMQD